MATKTKHIEQEQQHFPQMCLKTAKKSLLMTKITLYLHLALTANQMPSWESAILKNNTRFFNLYLTFRALFFLMHFKKEKNYLFITFSSLQTQCVVSTVFLNLYGLALFLLNRFILEYYES